MGVRVVGPERCESLSRRGGRQHGGGGPARAVLRGRAGVVGPGAGGVPATFTTNLGGAIRGGMVQHGRMPSSPRFKFTAAIVAAVLGFVVTLMAPESADIAPTGASGAAPKR